MSEVESRLFSEAIEFFQKKEYEKAKEKYREILKLNPKSAEAHGNLGVVLRANKEVQKAIFHYVEAIKLNPKNSLVFNNLGNAFKEVKDYKMAIRAFSDCIKLDPKNANAYNNLGMAYEAINDNDRAISCYKEAIRVEPKFSKAINNIGVVLYKQKKYEESAKIFQIALDTDPDYSEVYSNMGASYNKAKNYEKAIESLQIAIKKMPKHSGAYTNLGNVYNKIHDYKEAVKCHEKSIKLNPKGSNAYSNVGTSYKYLGQTKKAIESYKKAIELMPDFENAHFDLATVYLSIGDFLNGWREYEWRLKKEEMRAHIVQHRDIFQKPMYDGKIDISGKRLLVHSEQGFGDSIQFIRFISKLKEFTKATIILKTRNELKRLFSTIEEIDILVDRGEKTPEFDYHLPHMSMPYILGMKSFDDIPKKMPYLFSLDDEDVKIKKDKSKIDIGICWSASVTGESYDGKVFSLEYLKAIIENEKFNVYSLQVGPEKEDIKKLGLEDRVIDITSKLTDFAKTASLIGQLDLVISSDTSVAHLAGAMNKEVWIPLQKVPDWRWKKSGESVEWYPSAKLFRQKSDRVWDSVFQSINSKLSKKFKTRVK